MLSRRTAEPSMSMEFSSQMPRIPKWTKGDTDDQKIQNAIDLCNAWTRYLAFLEIETRKLAREARGVAAGMIRWHQLAQPMPREDLHKTIEGYWEELDLIQQRLERAQTVNDYLDKHYAEFGDTTGHLHYTLHKPAEWVPHGTALPNGGGRGIAMSKLGVEVRKLPFALNDAYNDISRLDDLLQRDRRDTTSPLE